SLDAGPVAAWRLWHLQAPAELSQGHVGDAKLLGDLRRRAFPNQREQILTRDFACHSVIPQTCFRIQRSCTSGATGRSHGSDLIPQRKGARPAWQPFAGLYSAKAADAA